MFALRLIAAAATAGARAGRLAVDESLDAAGRAAAEALAVSPGRAGERLRCGPSLAARETAAALGLAAAVDPELRDLDLGSWAGRTLPGVFASDPEGAAAWLRDPAASPHGGESIAALLARTESWLHERALEGGRLLAVVPPAVIRAAVVCALGAPTEAFWRVEAEPLHFTRIAWDGRRFGVRSTNVPP